jgi:iron complex outermembrane recepter protein
MTLPSASHRASVKLLVALAIFGVAGNALAQARIEEVVVTAPKRERRALQPAVEMDRVRVAERAPVALTDVLESLPSVGIRTNSRGEAVLRLRGSEERQTGIFLDGAPLSVPWDGRVDLSALPAGIVEGVRLTPSAAPIEYGPNAVLGVVDIQTPVSVLPGLRSLHAELATEDSGSVSAAGGADAGGFDWLFGGGYRRIGGEALSSTAVIPYGAVKGGRRANTDLQSTSLFVAASRQFDRAAARLSLFSVDAERGIASAGHIDPAAGLPRYWRYPHWRFDQLTANLGMDVGTGMSLRSVLWFQHFEQTIDQYTDDSYSVLQNSEDDKDNTLGGRLVLERPFDAFDLRLVGNAQVTMHDQVNTDHADGERGPLQSYQQNIFSLGAEFDTGVADNMEVSAALSYDLATTPKTGGHDAYDELSDWAASIAVRWYPNDVWQVAGTLGQRSRFPTLRELYGEALGQFSLNLDLRPETAVLGDVTFEGRLRDGQLRLRLSPWILRIDDTLSRRSVVVDGVRLRQRYNLEGSEGHGVEAGLDWDVHDLLELRLHGSWQDLEARLEEDGTRPALYHRPDFQASLVLDWIFAPEWDLFFEVRHLGHALDEDEDGAVVRLPASTSVNFRLFRTVHRDDAGQWRVYAGVDNLSDDVVLPQLGLPRPGRTASLGISFERL